MGKIGYSTTALLSQMAIVGTAVNAPIKIKQSTKFVGHVNLISKITRIKTKLYISVQKNQTTRQDIAVWVPPVQKCVFHKVHDHFTWWQTNSLCRMNEAWGAGGTQHAHICCLPCLSGVRPAAPERVILCFPLKFPCFFLNDLKSGLITARHLHGKVPQSVVSSCTAL